MKFRLIYLSILIFIFLVQFAFAEIVYERNFAQMGYESFAVEGVQNEDCTNYSFLLPSEVDLKDNALFPILSINAEFSPLQESPILISTFLNDQNLGKSNLEDFYCQDKNCWLRIDLPKENLAETNKLKVCAKTSNTTTKIIVSNKSMFGIYKTAQFLPENFVKMVSKRSPLIGEEITVAITLKNTGSKPAFVEIKDVRPIVDETIGISVYKIIKGKTETKGFINQNEEQKLEYTIRPTIVGRIAMPPAIAYFKNAFNEPKSLDSNVVFLEIRQPEIKINAFILKKTETEISPVGSTTPLTLAVKNVGKDPIFNTLVELKIPKELSLIEGDKIVSIASIKPNETSYYDFSVASSKEGIYNIGCRLTYLDLNITEIKCSENQILFQNPEISPAIIIGIIFVFIAVAIYLYIHFKKE